MEVFHIYKSNISFFDSNEISVTNPFEYLPEELHKYIISFLEPRKRESWNVILVSERFCRVGREALDPSFEGNRWLIAASKLDKVFVIRWLLSDPRVNLIKSAPDAEKFIPFDPEGMTAFKEDCSESEMESEGEEESVEIEYLTKYIVYPPVSKENGLVYALQKACKNGRVDIVKQLLKTPIEPNGKAKGQKTPLDNACFHGQLEVVKILLKDPRIKGSLDHFAPLYLACSKGHLAVVEELLSDARINPSKAENAALIASMESKSSDVALRLLKDPRIDPSYLNNEPLNKAIYYNKLDVIRELMKDERVRVSDLMLCNAICRLHEYPDILVQLLKDLNLDFSSNHNVLLETAIKFSNLTIFKVLLNDSRIQASLNWTLVLNSACRYGKCDIVKEILRNGSIDFTNQRDESLDFACLKGHLDIVKELLKHSCDPSRNKNRAIFYASKADIVRELLKDSRVDPSDLENRAFVRAFRNKNSAVCEALLEDSRVSSRETVKALLQKS